MDKLLKGVGRHQAISATPYHRLHPIGIHRVRTWYPRGGRSTYIPGLHISSPLRSYICPVKRSVICHDLPLSSLQGSRTWPCALESEKFTTIR